MKIPESIKVAGHIYKIEMMPTEWITDTGKRGQCDCNELVIRIGDGMPESRTVETLLHEIGHAIYHEYNVDGSQGEEHIVTAFGTGWHQVWLDCPELKKI